MIFDPSVVPCASDRVGMRSRVPIAALMLQLVRATASGVHSVELMVVIGIVAILVGLTLPAIRRHGKRRGVRTGTQRLKQMALAVHNWRAFEMHSKCPDIP